MNTDPLAENKVHQAIKEITGRSPNEPRVLPPPVKELTGEQWDEINRYESVLTQPLIRESNFKGGVAMLCVLVYSAPAIYFGLTAWGHALPDTGLLYQWPAIWRLAIAAGSVWYFVHAAEKATGLWYPLSLCEDARQEIQRRISEARKKISQ